MDLWRSSCPRSLPLALVDAAELLLVSRCGSAGDFKTSESGRETPGGSGEMKGVGGEREKAVRANSRCLSLARDELES